MGKRDLACWEIMGCSQKESCLAAKNPDRPCWMIAGEQNDYRSAFAVCQDCVVFMLKHENTTLSGEEIHAIMDRKITACALAQ